MLEGGETQPEMIDDHAQPGICCVVALLDIDDFVVTRTARGGIWADTEVAKVESLIDRAVRSRPDVERVSKLEPDEWIFVIQGDEPDGLGTSATELARELCEAVAQETAFTATVSRGTVRRGIDRTERSLADAVETNERKLVLGGNRIIVADDDLPAPSERLAPERIENELAERIRDADREGALELLKRWIAQSAELEGMTPEVLRSWLAAEILFVLNVVERRRLTDGSLDWVEAFGRTSFDELLSVRLIHEQSYLAIWLESVLARIIEEDPKPRTSAKHILALVETYIAENYASELSLTKVAQALYVSPFYISHLFHRELNTTFLRYLTAIRVAKARQL
ncbi:MAG: AraC family transcriptional regulator, partial [Vicinamibacteria bacterium]